MQFGANKHLKIFQDYKMHSPHDLVQFRCIWKFTHAYLQQITQEIYVITRTKIWLKLSIIH